jgi:hypothetical protein
MAMALPVQAQDTASEPEASDLPRTVKSAVTVDDVKLGGGTWLSPPRSAWVAAEKRRCEDDKKQLQDALEKKPLQPPETTGQIATAASIAGGGGIVVGILITLVGLIASGHIK